MLLIQRSKGASLRVDGMKAVCLIIEKREKTMKFTGMRKIAELFMIAVMGWSVFQIKNCVVLQSTRAMEGEIHWDILTYELLFLAAAMGLVTVIEKGIFKKRRNEEN